jgi:ATP-dependent DNA helicase RecG
VTEDQTLADLIETSTCDKKSLRLITGKNPAWGELAKDCVCFANGRGGHILIGIEDHADLPPATQTIPPTLIDQLNKRIREQTVNVELVPQIKTARNGGQYVELWVVRSQNIASTSDGRYYIRIGDQCKPIIGDEVLRLATDRTTLSWETQTHLDIPKTKTDPQKLQNFIHQIQASDRVKPSVKEKTADELLDHYYLAQDGKLTHLGILCLGQRGDRAKLGTAPIVQFIKYDDQHRKINKLVWDDYSLSPIELVETIWQDILDFREYYELADGLFRQRLPRYDEIVVRELLVNAIVHRPYTQRGDIFINLYPDHLQIVNPGTLPLGVTPQNILHTTVRRNDNLARIFHDLRLMEREGSGFDKIYEVLLSQGKRLPELKEGLDRVEVTVHSQILNPEIIDLLDIADRNFQLTQREKITLGLLAQQETLTTRELSEKLSVADEPGVMTSWLGRLVALELVQQTGKTSGTQYFLNPRIIQDLAIRQQTTLKRIEPHRLDALILEDLRLYPASSIKEIQQRIAPELPQGKIKRRIEQLIQQDQVQPLGENRWRRYRLRP